VDKKGFTLIEVMVALMVLLVVTAGVLPLTLVATKVAENEGHLMSRTTEYAQDKLEQLLALAYNDTTSDTRVFPATDAGGTGLTAGGSSDPDAPVASYVDYLDIDGTLVASAGNVAPDGWFYKRVWEIEIDVASATLKRVTVTAIVRTSSSGGVGLVPRATVAALKSFPF
jgi:prepilin-type N-terminal cleavage/methylation domain-containing protein